MLFPMQHSQSIGILSGLPHKRDGWNSQGDISMGMGTFGEIHICIYIYIYRKRGACHNIHKHGTMLPFPTGLVIWEPFSPKVEFLGFRQGLLVLLGKQLLSGAIPYSDFFEFRQIWGFKKWILGMWRFEQVSPPPPFYLEPMASQRWIFGMWSYQVSLRPRATLRQRRLWLANQTSELQPLPRVQPSNCYLSSLFSG